MSINLSVVTTVMALFIICGGAVHAAAAEPSSDSVPPHWSENEDCQATFLAVLTGCYRDGVPDAVIDAIITPPASSDSAVRHSFIFSCRLCHAAFDAFVSYRQRAPFLTLPGQPAASHFSTNDPQAAQRWNALLEELRSDEPSRRVLAMGRGLMRPWIVDHYRRQNLSAAALQTRRTALFSLAQEGTNLFERSRNELHSPYREWNFYGGCQACEAASDLEQLIEEQSAASAPAVAPE